MTNAVLQKSAPPRKGERTAERIRAVALDLFSRHGFDGVSMADVAAAADVSQASVHYHFSDKDVLWREAMLLLAPLMNAREHLAAITRAKASPGERLRLLMRHFVKQSGDCPALGRVFMREGMAGGPRLKWLISNVFGEAYRLQMKLVREAIEAGELKPHRPEQIVIMMQAAAATFFTVAPLAKAAFKCDAADPETRQAQEDLFIDVLFRGLEP